MRSPYGGYDLIEDETRDEGREYSFFQVYRKRADTRCIICSHPWKKPGTKMVCIVRYGGFGDMIQTSSLLPRLKDEGWHVTIMTTPKGKDIMAHDPHVDRFLLQDGHPHPDQVPNHLLSDYWAVWEKKFDRWINLSESIEGTLLAIPGRQNHAWPMALREKMMGMNYLEFTHAIADVEGPAKPAFYPTADERDWAVRQANRHRGFSIMWVLAGSSVHKAYPHFEAVLAQLMLKIPDAHVILCGDGACRVLERGWENEPRVMCTSGKWSIRQTLAAAQACDMVIGPETGVLNAVCIEHNTKIVLLSHSSPGNLTRDWINTDTIVPDVPCFPCHRLHYSREFCPEWRPLIEDTALRDDPAELKLQTEEGNVKDGRFASGVSICAASIHPDLIFERIQLHYDGWRTQQLIPATG
jgi:ADP-heptose:LPS heptosyltransferase